MSHWLYPANVKHYKVREALDCDTAVWPINSKVEVDDTIFIYLAAPFKRIEYACGVKDTNIAPELVASAVRPFLLDPGQAELPTKPFMLLGDIRPIPECSLEQLTYANLRNHGLKGMLMGPRKLENCPDLLDYVQEHARDL